MEPREHVRWQSPGRINLIGEHTDYNDGFALPLAIDAACQASLTRLDGEHLRVRSGQRADAVETTLSALTPGAPSGWAGYVLGAVWALQQLGHDVPGLSIDVYSEVPVGAGLSSSAALVCSVATALDDLLDLQLSAAELLELTRRVENDFVGAPTGGMDQLASLRCADGHALFCDMRSLATEHVPLELEAAGLTLAVLDTRTEHTHAGGEYRKRREACERSAALLEVPALRDVTLADLDSALGRLPSDELRRCTRHVVTENDRVLRTVELLRAGRIADIGPLLTQSHASMRDDYRITTAELDVAVESFAGAGALGARMTGGGFGGCVIALVPREQVSDAFGAVRAEFAARGFHEPGTFTVDRPARGAHRLAPGPA